jgi:methionyl-tRNA formyltransferase
VRALNPPAVRSPLPLLSEAGLPSLVELARDHCIPVLTAGRLSDPAAAAALAAFAPDLLCVACFPRRLPPPVLSLARRGGLNVHPSLLPRHRGPTPLFWTLHAGDETAGVTVHWLDEGIDTGPIALQEAVPLPAGTSGDALAADLARRGARLLARAVALLAEGSLPRLPQNPGAASYRSWPAAPDWIVPTTWPAPRAFRFLRGVAAWGQPLVRVDGKTFPIDAALDFQPAARLGCPWQRRGGDLLIQFSPGVLRARPVRGDNITGR